MDQAAAKVVQAKAKLAELIAAADEAALEWATSDEECQRQLEEQRNTAAKPPKLASILPAPQALPADQQAAWTHQVEEFLGKALQELKTALEAGFPVGPKGPDMEVDAGGNRGKRDASPSRTLDEPEGQKPRTSAGDIGEGVNEAAPPGASGDAATVPDVGSESNTTPAPAAATISKEMLAAKAAQAVQAAITAAEAAADDKEL